MVRIRHRCFCSWSETLTVTTLVNLPVKTSRTPYEILGFTGGAYKGGYVFIYESMTFPGDEEIRGNIVYRVYTKM